MDSSSGTPHLLTDVRFSVSRKGYDPDEVDNFLERVSAAVAQLQDKLRQASASAEAAEGRASDASRSQTLLQARVDKLEADLASARDVASNAPAGRSPEDEAAEVSKVLVLAQRTADAAVAEARATASQVVSEAEQEAARIVSSARTEADEAATRQREALASEVRSLESAREQLTGDIANLERYLEDQRASLRGALGRMQAVLDDPAALRTGAVPALTPVDVPAAPEHGGHGQWTSEGEASAPAEAEPTAGDTGSGAVADTVPEIEPESPTADDEAAAWRPGADEGAARPEGPSEGPEVAGGAASEPSGNGTESLFSVNDPTAGANPGGPPTAPVAVFDAEADEAAERFLGNDEEADAAMRAFFEADFDDDQRFGR